MPLPAPVVSGDWSGHHTLTCGGPGIVCTSRGFERKRRLRKVGGDQTRLPGPSIPFASFWPGRQCSQQRVLFCKLAAVNGVLCGGDIADRSARSQVRGRACIDRVGRRGETASLNGRRGRWVPWLLLAAEEGSVFEPSRRGARSAN
jgi:hypothetical protein